MAIKKEIDIVVNAEQANKSLKEVKGNVDANTEAVDGMINSIDKMSGGIVGAFKGMVSGAKAGISAMKTLTGAIIATGIGALVVVVGSLYAYFTKTEAGAQKLRIAFAAVGAVVDKLIDGFIAVGKFLTKIVKITGSVISGNKSLKEGWNDAKEAGKEMGKEIVDAYNNISVSMNKAIDLQRRENDLKVKQREGLVKEAQLLVELSEARAKIGDVLLTNAEREKAANDAIQLNNDLYAEKISKLKEAYNIQKERNALAESDEEAMMKEAELQAQLIQLEADRNNANKELITQRSGLAKQQLAEIQAVKDAEAKALEDKNKLIDSEIEAAIKKEEERLAKIQAVQDSFKQKSEDAAAQTELDRLILQQTRDLAALTALEASEAQKYEVKKYYEDQIFGYYQQKAKEKKELDKAVGKEKKELDKAVGMAAVDIAGQTAQLLSMMVKQDSKAYKVLQVAQVAASGIQAVQSSFMTASASPITTVFPAYPYIQAGLAGAFSAVQLAKIKSSGSGSSSTGAGSYNSGGGGAVQQTPPQFNIVQGTAGNQIAEGLNNNKTVLKTYVVSSEVSSQQELDRKIVATASI